MARRKSNDQSPALPRKKANAQATSLPSSASRPAESPPSQREKRKRTRSPSLEPSAKRARTQSPSDSVSSVGSIEIWPRPSCAEVEYDSDAGFTELQLANEAKLWAIMSGNDPTYFPQTNSKDEVEVEDHHTKSNDQGPALPRKKAKLQQASGMLDAQAIYLPSSASMPAELQPLQREKRKRTRSPSPEPSVKRARTQSPSDSVSSAESIEIWPRPPSPSGSEYDSDEGMLAGHSEECVGILTAVMSGNDPANYYPSDSEDESEVEDRHTPERPYQHPRGRLLSPELIGSERLPRPYYRISAWEAISSLSPQERWQPPREEPMPSAEQESSTERDLSTEQEPRQNKGSRRQKTPQRQPEPRKKRQSKPAPRVVEQILRSRRSSRRDASSQLWCLGDDGAPCLMTSKR